MQKVERCCGWGLLETVVRNQIQIILGKESNTKQKVERCCGWGLLETVVRNRIHFNPNPGESLSGILPIEPASSLQVIKHKTWYNFRLHPSTKWFRKLILCTHEMSQQRCIAKMYPFNGTSQKTRSIQSVGTCLRTIVRFSSQRTSPQASTRRSPWARRWCPSARRRCRGRRRRLRNPQRSVLSVFVLSECLR